MTHNTQKINEMSDFFHNLDRSIFIDNENKKYAHYNEPLSIGFEQTISQPTLVYNMTFRLDLNKNCKVLEIGTGSGYQTAFLAQFGGEVYTVERIEELSVKAQERIKKLGYESVKFKVGDGSQGWAEFSPYDRIMVTAAAGNVPEPLVQQLNKGGKMVIPVGPKGVQELLLITKDEQGNVMRKFIEMVRFVELKGDYGWRS